jgi:hypothetical protein
MTTTAVLRWPIPEPIRCADGHVIACPTCGRMVRLVLAMDLDDHTDAPSAVSCPAGHAWFEERLPRRWGALLLAELLDAEPGIFAHLEELQRVHGGA